MSKVTAWGAGVCLADDMGLGKTLQTITLLLEQSNEGASLVIAPASVVPNWRNELKRFSPTLNVIVLNQSDDRSKAIKDAQSGDVVIATYALLNTQQEEHYKTRMECGLSRRGAYHKECQQLKCRKLLCCYKLAERLY